MSGARDALEATSQLAAITIITTLSMPIIFFDRINFVFLLMFFGLCALSYLLYAAALASAREYSRSLIGCYDLFQDKLLCKLPKQETIKDKKERWKSLSEFLHEGRTRD